ncbi:hypothetical protein EDD11_007444 [Mortierella claussenii]|nr:hypothetical protein EDD11_007444 [Mortierella claussenii]
MATSQHSLRQMVRNQITEYSRMTQTLFTALELMAEGKTAPAAPNDVMQQIVKLDSTLMGAVEKIELHQRQQRRIRQVRSEIEEQNKAIMTVIQDLRDAKQVLETSLEDLDEKRAISADARSAEVSVSEIVAYANRLSNYTSAPPNFNPQDPNHPFEPPYPREVSMRAGILNQQHIPAAALVSLDGGVMPGTAGQLPPPTQSTSSGGAPGAPGAMGQTPAGLGVTVVSVNQGSGEGAGGVHTNSNGGHLQPHGMGGLAEEEEDDDSGSSSEEEGFSLYSRVRSEEERRQQERRQQEQQQQHHQQTTTTAEEDEDAAGIFDLDLN